VTAKTLIGGLSAATDEREALPLLVARSGSILTGRLCKESRLHSQPKGRGRVQPRVVSRPDAQYLCREAAMRPKRRTGGTPRARHLFVVGSGLEPLVVRSSGERDLWTSGLLGDADDGEYSVEWALPDLPIPAAEPVNEPARVLAARNASRSCHPAGTNRRPATQAG
jgi:hypothetical protein